MQLEKGDIRGLHLGILVVLTSSGLVVFLSTLSNIGISLGPVDSLVAYLTACPYLALTGKPCPLCGTTTAASLFLIGDMRGSLDANPVFAALLPLVFSQMVYRAVRIICPHLSLKEELLTGGFGLAALVGMLMLV